MDIVLIFIGLGYKDKNQAKVKIYNDEYCYINKSYNGRLNCKLQSNCLYHLIVLSSFSILDLYFYVDDKRCCYYFNMVNRIENKVTFHLFDKNYQNMPIERGNLILWQK